MNLNSANKGPAPQQFSLLFGRQSNAGFTLLEVLIAITLLVVISLAIFQATTQTYKVRDVLLHEGNFYNGIRLSMGILERDINAFFSPLQFVPPNKQKSSPFEEGLLSDGLQALLSGDLGRSTPFWSEAIDLTGIRPSRFQGSEQRISFIASSHQRLYKEKRESEFSKVIYELIDDKYFQEINRDPNISSAKRLVKSANSQAFDDNDHKDSNKSTYPLLDGITQFKFRFYSKKKEQWLNSWDSDNKEFKNTYPDIIELTLEVRGPVRLFFEGTYLFRPEHPFHGLSKTF